jgi:hypothetical protein
MKIDVQVIEKAIKRRRQFRTLDDMHACMTIKPHCIINKVADSGRDRRHGSDDFGHSGQDRKA